MARMWLGLSLTVLALALGCSTATSQESQYERNDVPVATLLYPTHGFQQSPPHEATGGRGTTHWNVYGPPGADSPFHGPGSPPRGRKLAGTPRRT